MFLFFSAIKSYFLKAYSWLDKNLGLVFVYSIPFVLTGLFIETVRFLGFLRKFGLDTLVLLTISVTFGLILFRREEKKSEFLLMLYNLLRLLCVGIIFFTIVVAVITIKTGASLLGSGNGQQFINISTLMVMVFYIILLLLLPYIAKRFTLRGSVGLTLFAVFIYVFVSQFYAFSELYLQRAGRAVSLITLNDGNRMAKFWNTVFPLMDVVNANTPPNAVILHPPQLFPWPETGNQFVIRRFLYPRTLIAPEFWDGTQEIDAVLADNGGRNAAYHTEVIGWPIEIFPIKKVVLAETLKRETMVTSFLYNEVPFVPQLEESQPKGSYEGEVKVSPQDEITTIDAEFTVPGHAFVFHTSPLVVKSGTSLGMYYKNDHQLQVAPVVSFMDSMGVKRYLHYTPNWKSDPMNKILTAPEEKVVIVDALERIQAFEQAARHPVKDTYEVQLGIDMGYLQPLPYLYGQSIVLLDKNPNIPLESCVEEQCWTLLEHLIYRKKFAEAQEVITRLEPLYRGTPRLAFYTYKVVQGLGKPVEEQIANLQSAKKYWTDKEYFNLPLFILRKMGVEKMKKETK
jgi:hypothetical protein